MSKVICQSCWIIARDIISYSRFGLIENGAHWDKGHKESESTDDNITYHI